MKIKFCPKCKSKKVIMPRGDNLWWECLECGFRGSIFPEIKLKTRKRK